MGTLLSPRTSGRAARRQDETPPLPDPWWRSTLAVAMLGQLLLWAAFPPLQLAALAWLAPVPWAMLARRDVLAGKRPYAALWLSSFLFHLAAL
jgi:hypothetical protein